MRKLLNLVFSILIIFSLLVNFSPTTAETYAEAEPKPEVIRIIKFDYEKYPELRKIAYKFIWEEEKEYMPWIEEKHIGIDLFDLNDNGEAEIFAYVDGEGSCPLMGCSFIILTKTSEGYKPLRWYRLNYTVFIKSKPHILSSKNNSYHDIVFEDPIKDPELKIWKWDGSDYQ